MIVLNEREQVKQIIQRWTKRHGPDHVDRRGRNVRAELVALDQETSTAADVAEIIGNSSWVRERSCDECGRETWDIVEFDPSINDESNTVYVCRDCLRAALRLFDGASKAC